MHSTFAHKTLSELAAENYKFASVLDSFGISFYQAPKSTLYTTCSARNLNVNTVLYKLLKADCTTNELSVKEIGKIPLHALVSYLKFSHRNFIRKKLPYMAKLIADIQPECFDQPEIAEDLKLIFPLFTEDFIHHIHEEEDTTFEYVLQLTQADKKRSFDVSKLFFTMRGISLASISEEHAEDDDEMEGIRDLTSNYAVDSSTGVYTKVVFSELQEFETMLQKHAYIENKILFPKALALEKRVKLKMTARARMN